MGHEFTSLVLALLWAGGHPPKVDADLLEQVRGLEDDLQVRDVFLALVPQLPRRGAGADADGAGKPRITATLIEGGTYQDEVDSARHHGGARDLPQRRTLLQRQDGTGRDPRQDRHRREAKAAEKLSREGPVRSAGDRRRSGRCGDRDLHRAQGYSHRRRGGAFRRPAARYAGHREPARHRLYRRAQAGGRTETPRRRPTTSI